jgi:hypothetical protein
MPSSTPAVSSQTSPTHTSQTPYQAPHACRPLHLMMVRVYWLMSIVSFLGLVKIVALSMDYPLFVSNYFSVKIIYFCFIIMDGYMGMVGYTPIWHKETKNMGKLSQK